MGVTTISGRSSAALKSRSLLRVATSTISVRVLAVIGCLALFRWLYLGWVPLDLAADEAYYWDWSRQLDWGYYSKPPMIAWIAAVATRLGGDNAWALRTPAVVCGAVALWGVFALARSLYGERVAWWAFLTAALTPGNAAMSLFMTIDAPFLCAWAFAVWCVWELFGNERSPRIWLPLAILATGLGLLSKQTMIAIIPLTGAWLATRRQAARPFPTWTYTGWMAGSLMFCLPALVWNLRNSWLTVQHTREHFQWRSLSLGRQVSLYLEFHAGQAGIISPLLYLIVIVLSLAALIQWRRLADRERFLLSLGLFPFSGITVLSCLQRVQPNWPVAFHLTGMILFSAWACHAWSTQGWLDRYRRLSSAALAVSAAFLMLFYATPVALPHTPWVGSGFDALSRLRGWKQIAADVDRLRRDSDETRDPLIVTMTGRGLVSQLAFYLPDHPRVYHWNPAGTIVSQHDVWGGPKHCAGRDALLVLPAEQPVPEPFAAACTTLKPLGRLRQERGGQRYDEFDVWLGSNLREWPSPMSLGTTPSAPFAHVGPGVPIAEKQHHEGTRQ